MPRNSSIPPESFEEILAWLDPERETAAKMYIQLREDLTKIFVWRQCSDPEGFTDEVFDRVARKIQEVRPTYEGDPRNYFRAVARKLILENLKKIRTHVSFEETDLEQTRSLELQEDDSSIHDCLHSCLQQLTPERRELVLTYYSKEKQAKIDLRSELADSLGITVEALRVKVFRIRASLENCIKRCLKSKVQ